MISRLARVTPVAGVSLMFVAAVAAQLQIVQPIVAFGLLLLGWLGGAVFGSLFGLLALRWSDPDPGKRRGARIGLAVSGALLAGLAVVIRGSRGPAIHDISTDLADPPRFEAALEAPANRDRDLTYPHGNPETPALQRQAYPDVRPIRVDAPPTAAAARVVDAANELGWRVVAHDDTRGHVEAIAVTRVFRFTDDIVIRIRPDGGGSRIDVRSTSRVGRSDLGANAARIRQFAALLGDPFDS